MPHASEEKKKAWLRARYARIKSDPALLKQKREEERARYRKKMKSEEGAQALRDRAKRWRDAHPDKVKELLRRANLRRYYGITPEQYDQLFEKQRGRCAICGTRNAGGKGSVFRVDHDHATGLVRGLLCNECNLGLGKFAHDKRRLSKAIDYLE